MFYIYACLSRWLSGKESACQCRRHRRCGFDPWVRKITQSRKWLPVPVFLPAKFHEQRSLMIESLRDHRVKHDWEHAHTYACTDTYMHTHTDMQLQPSLLPPAFYSPTHDSLPPQPTKVLVGHTVLVLWHTLPLWPHCCLNRIFFKFLSSAPPLKDSSLTLSTMMDIMVVYLHLGLSNTSNSTCIN